MKALFPLQAVRNRQRMRGWETVPELGVLVCSLMVFTAIIKESPADIYKLSINGVWSRITNLLAVDK
ncbi:MAG: hypothetical protein WAU54_07355 [Chania sp.]